MPEFLGCTTPEQDARLLAEIQKVEDRQAAEHRRSDAEFALYRVGVLEQQVALLWAVLRHLPCLDVIEEEIVRQSVRLKIEPRFGSEKEKPA